MGKYLKIQVISYTFSVLTYDLDYKFDIDDKGEISEGSIPSCQCKTKGKIRPNILLYNDSE